MLGVVTGIGALAAVLANPLAGALSDRTSLRLANRHFGRRHVWTAVGALIGALALVLLARQHTDRRRWRWPGAPRRSASTRCWPASPPRSPTGCRCAQRGVRLRLGGHPAVAGPGARRGAGHRRGHRQRRRVRRDRARRAAAVAAVRAAAPRTTTCPGSTARRCGCARCSPSFWISPRRHPDFAWAWVTRFLVQTRQRAGHALPALLPHATGYGLRPTPRAAC